MREDPVVKALRQAIEKEDSIELRLALGHHLSAHGDSKAALGEFEEALRFDASSGEALEAAAKAAGKCGERQKANAYRLALGHAPTTPLPHQAAAAADEPLSAPTTPMSADEVREADQGGDLRMRLVSDHGDVLDDVAAEPVLRLTDVGGLEDVKTRLERSFLRPLRRPDLYRKFGKRIKGGFVLYGPPGCGKTFLARALAGELAAKFVSIGLSQVLDMWFGESERKLHSLFENARRSAPSLVFLDEVDALGRRRTQLKHSGGRTLVNQLLSELDGIETQNEGIFCLAATNHPWDLDPALRRPGRFDRMLFVPPPDLAARRTILELKLKGRPVSPKIDLMKLARRTEGFSGADLEAMIELATDLAIEASLDADNERPIDAMMLESATADIRPSTRPWFETARNYALYSNEGGVYDDLVQHLRVMGLT